MKLTDLIDAKYRSPTHKYYCDYPTVKIGGGNPYYKCASCGRSDPEINGRLEGHEDDCEWVLNKKKELNTNT